MEPKKDTLPFGWVVKQSKSYPDRVYYFNINSGASTWEFPDLIQPYLDNKGKSQPLPALSATALNSPDPSSLSEASQNQPQHSRSNIEAASPMAKELQQTPTSSKKSRIKSNTFEPDSRSLVSRFKDSVPQNSARKFIPSDRETPCTVTSHTSPMSAVSKSPTQSPSVKTLPINYNQTRRFGSIQAKRDSLKILASSNSLKTHSSGGIISLKADGVCKKILKVSEESFREDSLAQLNSSGSKIDDKSQQDICIAKGTWKSVPKSKLDIVDLTKSENTKCTNEKLGPQTQKEVKSLQKSSPKCGSGKAQDGNKRKLLHPYSSSSITADKKSLDKQNSVAADRDVKKPISPVKTPESYQHYQNKIVTKSPLKVSESKASSSYLGSTKITGKRSLETVEESLPSLTKSGLVLPASKRLKTCPSRLQDSEQTQENRIGDSRKVIRPQYKTPTEAKKVSVKYNQLVTLPTETGHTKTCVDLEVNTSVKSESRESEDKIKLTGTGFGFDFDKGTSDFVNDDRNNNTEYRLFIGNKEKLLGIQSWINNIEENTDWSDSSSREDLPRDTCSASCNQSTESGYISIALTPTPSQRRGWPGQAKAIDWKSREIVAMDIDACLFPSNAQRNTCTEHGNQINTKNGTQINTENGNHMEAMEIDYVLTELRTLMKSQTLQHVESFGPENFRDQTSQGDTEHTQLVVVLDTNVLISNLSMVDDMKDMEIPMFGKPCLYVPWIVLVELDRLKGTMSNIQPTKWLKTQLGAKKAISFLKKLFEDQHPRLIKQTVKQFEEAKKEFEASCNDDNILQACLMVRKQYDHMVLFTNDNNLITKSFCCDILAFNSKDVHKGIENIVSNPAKSTRFTSRQSGQSTGPITPPTMAPIATTTTNTAAFPSVNMATAAARSFTPRTSLTSPVSKQCVTQHDRDVPTGNNRSCTNTSLKSVLDDMYCKMKTALHEALGTVLEQEMKTVYNEIWHMIVFRKPPWSLKDILECWKKHWIAVFGMIFPRRLIHNVESLLDFFTQSCVLVLTKIEKALGDAVEILDECVIKKKYGLSVETMTRCIHALKGLCKGLQTGTVTPETVTSLDNYLTDKLGVFDITSHRSSTSVEALAQNVSADNKTNLQHSRLRDIGFQTNIQSPNHIVSNNMGVVDSGAFRAFSNTGDSGSRGCSKPNCLVPSVQSNGYNNNASNIESKTSHLKPNSENSRSFGTSDNVHLNEMKPVDCKRFGNLNQSSDVTNGNEATTTGSEVIRTSTGSDVVLREADRATALNAGTRLEQIWKFIHNSCQEIQDGFQSNQIPVGIATQLQLLVATVMDLRISYVGLLEFPVSELTNREREFTALTNICNGFFHRFQLPDPVPVTVVLPTQLLTLYSLPEFRVILQQLHVKVDEMLRFLYQFVQALTADD
ncbi:uncharacterized protein LOC127838207 [Dreissena polymorpha]|nr:uncharacterized protein LOC127838207 [Dreissena polymorpha]